MMYLHAIGITELKMRLSILDISFINPMHTPVTLNISLPLPKGNNPIIILLSALPASPLIILLYLTSVSSNGQNFQKCIPYQANLFTFGRTGLKRCTMEQLQAVLHVDGGSCYTLSF